MSDEGGDDKPREGAVDEPREGGDDKPREGAVDEPREGDDESDRLQRHQKLQEAIQRVAQTARARVMLPSQETPPPTRHQSHSVSVRGELPPETMTLLAAVGLDLTDDQRSQLIEHHVQRQTREQELRNQQLVRLDEQQSGARQASMRRHGRVLLFLAFVLVLVVGAIWLFLDYEHAELVRELLVALVALLGGGGVTGAYLMRKRVRELERAGAHEADDDRPKESARPEHDD